MTVDRWNPRKIISDAPKGPAKVFVPGDWKRAYRCPVHGIWETEVDSARPPAVMPCPLESFSPPGSDKEYPTCEAAERVAIEAGYQPGEARHETQRCAEDSVLADVSCAPSTVTEHPAGFRVRQRGDTSGTVVHAYRCPVHGVFDAHVSREEVPDAVLCGEHTAIFCGRMAPWAGSSCGIGISSGMVKS